MASWRDRVVIVAAALASIATSRKRWYLAVDLPPKPATTRPVQLVLEASERPDFVRCNYEGRDLGAEPAITGPRFTYLCPPGGQFVGPVSIDGYPKGGGCNDEVKPPPDAYLRLVSLEETGWSIKTTVEVPFAHTNGDGVSGHAEFVVHAPGKVYVTLDPAAQVRGPGSDGVYRVDENYRDPKVPDKTITVRAVAFGTGAAPADAKIEIEER